MICFLLTDLIFFLEYVTKFLENSKFRLKETGFKGKTLFGITTISVNRLSTANGNVKMPKELTEGLLVWNVIEGTIAHRYK